MFRSKGLLLGIALALALVYSPGLTAQVDAQQGSPSEKPAIGVDGAVTEVPDEAPDDVLGYYTTDGGKTFIPIKEEKGVAERIPDGTSKEEFMEAHRMSPEAEAAIVQQVPTVPIIIDGVLYQPGEIHLFDGKQLGFTVGDDGQLYAFTSFAGLEDFMEKQSQFPTLDTESESEYSYFYEYAGYLKMGQWAWVLTGVSLYTLDLMDDMISSVEVSPMAANGCTLFEYENLQGLWFYLNPGQTVDNLGDYGWNDRASSLVVWPR